MGSETVARQAMRATGAASPVVELASRRAVAALQAGGGGVAAVPRAPDSATFELTADESQRFLRIISQSLRVQRHYELFQLLQGDVQYFIPHQVLVSAWGDFGAPQLKLDVISALPGVRTSRLQDCDVEDLLRELYVRWLGHARQPLLLDLAFAGWPVASACRCPLHQSLRGMKAVLVHGIHNVRDGLDSLYVTASSDPILKSGNGIARFHFLVDTIVCQVDAAFRRVAGLKRRGELAPRQSGAGRPSTREIEILRWVSIGRTNAEIARLLSISPFTVKNHMKRILRKLGAANRTEAAAKYRKGPAPAQG